MQCRICDRGAVHIRPIFNTPACSFHTFVSDAIFLHLLLHKLADMSLNEIVENRIIEFGNRNTWI